LSPWLDRSPFRRKRWLYDSWSWTWCLE
jgi:hypothetical protein